MKLLQPPRFAPDDPEGDAYLREHGYAVYRDVAAPDQIARAHDLFWEFMRSLGTGIVRDDAETWRDEAWPLNHQTGTIGTYNVGHSAFLWYVRALAPIRKIFARVWNDDKLLVSFDGCGVFRPRGYDPKWSTDGGWYHFDQNGRKRKGLHCYQGLVNLMPAGPDRGGLVVVPGSVKHFDEYFVRHPEAGEVRTDFVRIPDEHLGELGSPGKICCEAGDLVLWDSRTTHCSTPALSPPVPSKESKLERLVAYVCMTPLAMATDPDLIAKRKRAFEEGITTDHWPHQFEPSYMERIQTPRPPYTPIVLDDVQRRLAFG